MYEVGEAGGKTGILPELIAFSSEGLQKRLLNGVETSGCIFSDRKDAEVVPIPKKGNLHHCDNWRGISLLDTVGKVCVRIIQDRLQKVVEEKLLDSQCSF